MRQAELQVGSYEKGFTLRVVHEFQLRGLHADVFSQQGAFAGVYPNESVTVGRKYHAVGALPLLPAQKMRERLANRLRYISLEPDDANPVDHGLTAGKIEQDELPELLW